MNSFTFALGLSLVFFQAATPAAAPSKTETQSFHSDEAKLDYTYPKSFADTGGMARKAMDEQKDKAQGLTKAAFNCVTAPIVGMDFTNSFKMLMLFRMDESCLGTEIAPEDLGGAAIQILRQSMASLGTPVMGVSKSYKIGDHDAALITATTDSAQMGKKITGAGSCLITGKNIVCWEFVTDDCSKLAEMGAYPVKLEGQDALPVIPAKMLPSCTAAPAPATPPKN